MNNAKQYREYAEACQLFAEQADDEHLRLTWCMMAAKWLQWAREEEVPAEVRKRS